MTYDPKTARQCQICGMTQPIEGYDGRRKACLPCSTDWSALEIEGVRECVRVTVQKFVRDYEWLKHWVQHVHEDDEHTGNWLADLEQEAATWVAFRPDLQNAARVGRDADDKGLLAVRLRRDLEDYGDPKGHAYKVNKSETALEILTTNDEGEQQYELTVEARTEQQAFGVTYSRAEIEVLLPLMFDGEYGYPPAQDYGDRATTSIPSTPHPALVADVQQAWNGTRSNGRPVVSLKQKQAIALVTMLGYSEREAGELLGNVSQSAVSQRISTGMVAMLDYLNGRAAVLPRIEPSNELDVAA